MATTNVARSKELRRRSMLTYRNSDVVVKLERKLDISYPGAKILFKDLKRFLVLCVEGRGQTAPPPQIDLAWHEFILFTEDYEKFCHEHAKRFIHHRPSTRRAPVDPRAHKRTIARAKRLFGELSVNWGSKRPPSLGDTCTRGCAGGPWEASQGRA